MIVLNLSCGNGHLFEGWFASADAFESQCRNGQVSCPVCGDAHIERRPSAPYVNTGSTAKRSDITSAAPPAQAPAAAPTLSPKAMAHVVALLRQVGQASEDVGERFAEEARRMHYGEVETRCIKGQATGGDVAELLEEGIPVLPLPPDEDLH